MEQNKVNTLVKGENTNETAVATESKAKIVNIYGEGVTFTTKTNQITKTEVEVPDGLVIQVTDGGITTTEKLPDMESEIEALGADATEETKNEKRLQVIAAIREAVRAAYLVKAMKMFGGRIYQGTKIPQVNLLGKGWGGSVTLEKKEDNDTPKSYLARNGKKITAAIDKDVQLLISSADICADFENGIK